MSCPKHTFTDLEKFILGIWYSFSLTSHCVLLTLNSINIAWTFRDNRKIYKSKEAQQLCMLPVL